MAILIGMVPAPDVAPPVTIYTDGACWPNPGPGGWGYVVYAGDAEIGAAYGSAPGTTSNRMELAAAAESLNALSGRCMVLLRTDSRYLRSGITSWLPRWRRNGWVNRVGEPVKNRDLWQWIDQLTRRHEVKWEWVRGHSGIAGNEYADQLAERGAAQARADGGASGPVVVLCSGLVDPARPAAGVDDGEPDDESGCGVEDAAGTPT